VAAAEHPRTGKTSRPWQVAGAGVVAIGACAVCCAGPVLAVLGGLSIASLAGAVWIPALAVVAVIAFVGMVWVLRRRRRATGPQRLLTNPLADSSRLPYSFACSVSECRQRRA
jgi:nitrate/nitrite transporter NarK